MHGGAAGQRPAAVRAQYRQAIASYYASGQREFPARLEDLLLDPRFPSVKRHLRRLYPDPITGGAEWGLVKLGDRIVGVYSLAPGVPLKEVPSGSADDPPMGGTSYSEWKFVVDPRTQAQAAVPPGHSGRSVQGQQGQQGQGFDSQPTRASRAEAAIADCQGRSAGDFRACVMQAFSGFKVQRRGLTRWPGADFKPLMNCHPRPIGEASSAGSEVSEYPGFPWPFLEAFRGSPQFLGAPSRSAQVSVAGIPSGIALADLVEAALQRQPVELVHRQVDEDRQAVLELVVGFEKSLALLRVVALHRGGIGDPPVRGHRLPRPDRADLAWRRRNGKDEIQRGRAGLGELFPVLAAQAGGGQAVLLQQLDGVGLTTPFG
jgi:hypothetical protein